MGESVICKCEALIGEVVEVEGQEMLSIGNVTAYDLHGVCGYCGNLVHWSAGGRALSELVRKVLKMRKANGQDNSGKEKDNVAG